MRNVKNHILRAADNGAGCIRLLLSRFSLQQGARGTTRVYWSCPSLRAPLLCPNVPLIIGGQLLEASIGQRSLGFQIEALRGASAAKASHTHRMSRSTRNHARKYLMFSKFCRSKRLEARGEANMWPLLDMSLGHATRVEPIHRSHQC